MKEHPILFSGAMVRAILAGTKTQTRRVVKRVPPIADEKAYGKATFGVNSDGSRFFTQVGRDGSTYGGPMLRCPFGAPGGRLWVRETWNCYNAAENEIAYQADMSHERFITSPDAFWVGKYIDYTWKPSIHMPRWASRITLEVTDVCVERLQDISDEDAKAEGLGVITKDGGRLWKYGIPDRDGIPGNDDDGWHWCEWEADPRKAYAKLWDSINGPGAWALNPWVWCVSFRRVTP